MTGIGKFFLKINSYNPLGCAKHLHLGTIKNVSTVNYQSLNKWGVYNAVVLLVFSKAACYLEGQKKCHCCILAWTKITLSVQHNFLQYTVLENNRKCLEIMKRVC